ncbi:type II secretion system protein GspD [uncultured Selenomonas sp.]|uniref:type II secretion system protein GspD n=2 Tax=uncultured Selenomonas sp. TaxID=159275 RepID=UPI0025E3A4A6|nr:type II and III secretion system protein [uncultured Selenomonas sp.]
MTKFSVLLRHCVFALAIAVLPSPASAAPVALHFDDAEVAEVLQAAARLGGYGIVLDSDVRGRITVDTSAEPADLLPRVARMYGLAAELRDGVFYISSAAHAENVRQTYVFPVHYSAPEALLPAINLSLPEAGKRDSTPNSSSDTKKKEIRPRTARQTDDEDAENAKAQAENTASRSRDDTRATVGTDGQSVVLYGTPAEADATRQLLRELDVPARQVALEAKVISLTNDASRELGVTWDWSPLPQYEGTRTYKDDSAIPGIVQFGRGPEGHPFEWYYEAQLHALEQAGKAKVLSRPNITTLTGREAVIEIGSEVPVPEVETTSRSTTTSFTYHKAGIILRYTPYVSDDGRITAIVHTEVSSPVYVEDLKAYRFNKRSADTSVRLKDGETMVIGGLIGSEEAKSYRKIPLLGDIPVLGAFFKNVQKSKQSSEIMIFLTARILPSDDSQ